MTRQHQTRNPPTKRISALTRNMMRESIMDRRWHHISELVATFKTTIPPEKAANVYCLRTGGGPHKKGDETLARRMQSRRSEPFATQVAKGRLLIVGRYIETMISDGIVEQKGSGFDKHIRLNEWYCWSCGHRNTTSTGRSSDLKMCHDCDSLIHSHAANGKAPKKERH